jgi:hypothetical protein
MSSCNFQITPDVSFLFRKPEQVALWEPCITTWQWTEFSGSVITFFAKQGCSIMNCYSPHIRQVTSLCLPLRSRVMRNAVAFFPPSPHISLQSEFMHSYPPLHFPTRLLCGLDLLGFMSKKWYSKLSLASFNLPSGVIAVTCNNIYIVTNNQNTTTHHMMWIYKNMEIMKPRNPRSYMTP